MAEATWDLATLSALTEDSLLEKLKHAYQENVIYTYVGDILVAINPFQDLGLYSKKHVNLYKLSKRGQQPPHIFGVADMSYQLMLGLGGNQAKNQCILISGESGAGKTESTKYIIKQLTELSKSNSQLEQQILQVNPLMEAFGNAQTIMNDNSSRYGRYILLKFVDGQVRGSKISEYLLEKSRVVHQATAEQNFHIFYYIFAGTTDEEKNMYCLKSPESYKYLSDGGQFLKDPRKMKIFKESYDSLMDAMDIVGFTSEEQNSMFQILSGILALGNVDFEFEDDKSKVVDKECLRIAADILGIKAEDLEDILTRNCIFTAGQEIIRNYTVEQATDCRDAIAKAIYGRVFGWLVNKVNQLLAPRDHFAPEKMKEIGILDIFGFEHLEKNSFEQACINLANEQLQFFFNEHIFKLEQEEYKLEDVDGTQVFFKDNQPVLDLFIAKHVGLLALLDEECNFPQRSDMTFVEKLNDRFVDNEYYEKCKRGKRPHFTIKHYAGKVEYDAVNWLDKNRDTMPQGVHNSLIESTNVLLRQIFKAKVSRTGTLSLQQRMSRITTKKNAMQAAQNTKGLRSTLGAQFKNSLQVLIERLSASNPLFVRCIKPNNSKLPQNFDDACVKDQLLYTGLLETVTIRREGYAFRPTFAEFVNGYQVLDFRTDLPPTAGSCSTILNKCDIEGWQIGKTKVFLRYHHVDRLTEEIEKLEKKVVHMQRAVRSFLARREVERRRKRAQEEAAKIAEFARLMNMHNGISSENQSRIIAEDEQIAQDKFKEQEELLPPPDVHELVPPKTPVIAVPSFNDSLPEVPARRTTESPAKQSDKDVEEGAVLEDDFEPIDTEFKKGFSSPWGEVGSRQASVQWFRETQDTRVRSSRDGSFEEWFHGIIRRQEAEQMLRNQPVGSFLVRVSESRFGYTLSFNTKDKVRHYMIDVTRSKKYNIVGESKVHKSLKDMVEYYKRHQLSNWEGMLSTACGQLPGKCDFEELIKESPSQTPQPSADTNKVSPRKSNGETKKAQHGSTSKPHWKDTMRGMVSKARGTLDNIGLKMKKDGH